MSESIARLIAVSLSWEGISTNLNTIINSVFYILIVILMTLVLNFSIARMIRRTLMRKSKKENQAPDRLDTLLPLVQSISRYVVYFMAVVIILQRVGVNTSAILATAGVLGLAVGFGAQNLVKDILSGFFILFDGLIRVGDVITVGSATGLVVKVDLRNTLIREFNGRLWAFPNGDIRSFGNFNRDWCRAVVEVGMAYEQNVNKGLKALQEVARQWNQENPDLALEEPQAQGVLDLADSSVNLRIVAKVPPLRHWEIERDLRKRIKDFFDEHDVEIPFPRVVQYNRQD